MCRLTRDCDVLGDIIDPCSEISAETETIMFKVKENLQFVKIYVNAKEHGHCTEHSTVDNLVLKSDCTKCKSVEIDIQ